MTDNEAVAFIRNEIRKEYPFHKNEIRDYFRESTDLLNGKGERYAFRWWDEVRVVVECGGRYFHAWLAEANRDESVEELGWPFDEQRIREVKKVTETVVVTKYV